MSEILHPFELACQSKSSSLQSIAIDCIGKLFTYDYWEKLYQYNEDHKKKLQKHNIEFDKNNEDKVNWIDFSIDLICNCFSGGDTNDEIQTQITKVCFQFSIIFLFLFSFFFYFLFFIFYFLFLFLFFIFIIIFFSKYSLK